MKVLVTGARGQLGVDMVAACRREDDEVTEVSALDVGDRESVRDAVVAARPDAIVHTAAWTDVDACESDPDRAWRSNVLGTRHVVAAAREVGAYVCYVSTDYVFDGTKPAPYVESDVPSPRSVYGRSKLDGEREIVPDDGASIVRTSWLCSDHGSNMVLTALRLAADRENQLAFVDDQRGSPTFTLDLAPAIRRLVAERRPGIFHVTNAGATTWFGFVRDVLARAGHDPARVRPITTAELAPHRPACRPVNSVLENAALRSLGWSPLPDYRETLERVVERIVRG